MGSKKITNWKTFLKRIIESIFWWVGMLIAYFRVIIEFIQNKYYFSVFIFLIVGISEGLSAYWASTIIANNFDVNLVAIIAIILEILGAIYYFIAVVIYRENVSEWALFAMPVMIAFLIYFINLPV
ncbi:hypothetical protein ACFL1A_02810 [Patescibacteria group bacterium]